MTTLSQAPATTLFRGPPSFGAHSGTPSGFARASSADGLRSVPDSGAEEFAKDTARAPFAADDAAGSIVSCAAHFHGHGGYDDRFDSVGDGPLREEIYGHDQPAHWDGNDKDNNGQSGEFLGNGIDHESDAMDDQRGDHSYKCGSISDTTETINDTSYSDNFSEDGGTIQSEDHSEASVNVLKRYLGLSAIPYGGMNPKPSVKEKSSAVSVVQSEAQSDTTMNALMRYMGLSSKPYGGGTRPNVVSIEGEAEEATNIGCESPPCTRKTKDSTTKKAVEVDNAAASDDASQVQSEASMNVLMRYVGCSSKPYPNKKGTEIKCSMKKKTEERDIEYKHHLREGDHVIRWKMLGYCYPIQVHGIVFSAGPDFVTIVDCGLSQNCLDKVGDFEERDKKNGKKTRKRLNVLTLVDEKEIKKWTKIRYGEEVQLKVHSRNESMQKRINEKPLPGESAEEKSSGPEEFASAGLEMEEVEQCVQAKIKPTPEKSKPNSPQKSPSWFSLSCKNNDDSISAEEEVVPEFKSAEKEKPTRKSPKLRLPKADPPPVVLARLRFLLEHGEEPFPPPSGENIGNKKRNKRSLLPPHHLLYANSECIAVYCKTGSWSTLQASIFLHSSTVGNAKQTATVAMFLSSQTVTVPASGLWGFFGGTTTVSLFTAQPWLVPALVGGGMVYIGLPMLMLWKANARWVDTEKRLNDAFWSMYDTSIIVEMIQCHSSLEG